MHVFPSSLFKLAYACEFALFFLTKKGISVSEMNIQNENRFVTGEIYLFYESLAEGLIHQKLREKERGEETLLENKIMDLGINQL